MTDDATTDKLLDTVYDADHARHRVTELHEALDRIGGSGRIQVRHDVDTQGRQRWRIYLRTTP